MKSIFVSRNGSEAFRIESIATILRVQDGQDYQYVICQRPIRPKQDGRAAEHPPTGLPVESRDLTHMRFARSRQKPSQFRRKSTFPGKVPLDTIAAFPHFVSIHPSPAGHLEDPIEIRNSVLSKSTLKLLRPQSEDELAKIDIMKLDRDDIAKSQALLFEARQAVPTALTQIHIGIAQACNVPIICFSTNRALLDTIKKHVPLARELIINTGHTGGPSGGGPASGQNTSRRLS